MSGRFVTFEGGEGVGKSTQARLLAGALETRGLTVVLTREPGGTPGAEAIRELLLDPARAGEDSGWNPAAEALLFAAARADHVARLIRPALARGAWVVCDRFVDSTRAYQGGEGALSDNDILELHRIGSGGLLPDRTVLVAIDPAEAAARLEQRDRGASDRIGGREPAYHADVARRFNALAEAEPSRIVTIDGAGSPETVHARVLAELRPLLDTADG